MDDFTFFLYPVKHSTAKRQSRRRDAPPRNFEIAFADFSATILFSNVRHVVPFPPERLRRKKNGADAKRATNSFLYPYRLRNHTERAVHRHRKSAVARIVCSIVNHSIESMNRETQIRRYVSLDPRSIDRRDEN